MDYATPTSSIQLQIVETLFASLIFLHQDCQAGVFHVTNRFLDRVYDFDGDGAKDQFLKIMRAYEDLLGLEVLT